MDIKELYNKLESFIRTIINKMIKNELRSNYLISRIPIIISRYDKVNNSASIIIPTDMNTPTEYYYPNRSGQELVDGQKAYLLYQQGNISQGWIETNNAMRIIGNSTIDINMIYPIGSVITNSKSTFNPNTLYPNTTWERIKGKVIVGVDENDGDFNTINKTGGAKTHTLTTAQMPSHTHTQNAHNHSASSGVNDRSHTHYLSLSTNATGNHQHNGYYQRVQHNGSGLFSATMNDVGSVTSNPVTQGAGNHSHTVSGSTDGISTDHYHSIAVNNATATNQNTGSGQEHNNLQPYITKYVWERVA